MCRYVHVSKGKYLQRPQGGVQLPQSWNYRQFCANQQGCQEPNSWVLFETQSSARAVWTLTHWASLQPLLPASLSGARPQGTFSDVTISFPTVNPSALLNLLLSYFSRLDYLFRGKRHRLLSWWIRGGLCLGLVLTWCTQSTWYMCVRWRNISVTCIQVPTQPHADRLIDKAVAAFTSVNQWA